MRARVSMISKPEIRTSTSGVGSSKPKKEGSGRARHGVKNFLGEEVGDDAQRLVPLQLRAHVVLDVPPTE